MSLVSITALIGFDRQYGSLLKGTLDDFKERWNNHRIRPNRVAGCPPGVPDDLYSLPQLQGTKFCKCIRIDNIVTLILF